jgi:site-specific DNA-methyltransferase (adenine-specific)
MKDISANSIDLIICDLPYGCLTIEKKSIANPANAHRKECPPTPRKACSWDVKIDLDKFWTEAKRILKNEHSPVIHFCTTKFGIDLIKSNPDWFRYDLVWNKQRGVSFLSVGKMPMRSHEMIYIFCKSGTYYNRVDISGNPYKFSGNTYSNTYNLKIQKKKEKIVNTRCALSVINITTKATKGAHPTEKPIELYRWLIQRYCPPGGTILDPTFGSGNSVFTAYEMGMNAIGIEKNDEFYDKAKNKLNTIE